MREIVGPVMGFDEVERSGDIVIEARHLSKAYDKPLFQDLNLAVLRGQCVGVMGPNGSGKTTLIKTLIGREKPDRGEVKLGHKVQVGYHDQGLQSLDAEHDRRPRRLARGRPRLGRGRRPQPARPLRPDRRDRLPDRRPALRRREGQGRAGPALRHGGQPAGHGRADQPPRHLVVRGARAVDQRVRGDRPGRQPRPLLPQPGRRPADRPGRRTAPASSRATTRPISTCVQKEKEAAADKAEHHARPPLLRPARATADRNGGSKKKFPYRKAADLEREIGEVETEVAELEDLLGQPATWRDPVKAVTTQDRHARSENQARDALPALGVRRRIELVIAADDAENVKASFRGTLKEPRVQDAVRFPERLRHLANFSGFIGSERAAGPALEVPLQAVVLREERRPKLEDRLGPGLAPGG